VSRTSAASGRLGRHRRSQVGAHAETDWSTGSCTMGRQVAGWDFHRSSFTSQRLNQASSEAVLPSLSPTIPAEFTPRTDPHTS
jgi:hypothetical protein